MNLLSTSALVFGLYATRTVWCTSVPDPPSPLPSFVSSALKVFYFSFSFSFSLNFSPPQLSLFFYIIFRNTILTIMR